MTGSRTTERPMRPVPIGAAKMIALAYGYDQVVIVARRVGQDPDPGGEHVTTFGIDADNCRVAARAGTALKRFMNWPAEPTDTALEALSAAIMALRSYEYGNSAPDLARDVAASGQEVLRLAGYPPGFLVIDEPPEAHTEARTGASPARTPNCAAVSVAAQPGPATDLTSTGDPA